MSQLVGPDHILCASACSVIAGRLHLFSPRRSPPAGSASDSVVQRMGSSPPSPLLDLPPMRLTATAMVSCVCQPGSCNKRDRCHGHAAEKLWLTVPSNHLWKLRPVCHTGTDHIDHCDCTVLPCHVGVGNTNNA